MKFGRKFNSAVMSQEHAIEERAAQLIRSGVPAWIAIHQATRDVEEERRLKARKDGE